MYMKPGPRRRGAFSSQYAWYSLPTCIGVVTMAGADPAAVAVAAAADPASCAAAAVSAERRASYSLLFLLALIAK